MINKHTEHQPEDGNSEDSKSNFPGHQGTPNVPALVSLFELRQLGQFTRCQDITAHLTKVLQNPKTPPGYPLFPTRLRPEEHVDLLLESRWERVAFIKYEDGYIHYSGNSGVGRVQYTKYSMAPSGLYTAYSSDRPDVGTARLPQNYRLDSGSYMTKFELVDKSIPYVTFQIHFSDGRGGSGWTFETFHIADPRIQVDGVTARQPFYNSPIAVSHRWLAESNPDPNRQQFQEFLALCERLQLLDCQTFFIDYCSLPQRPRTTEEDNVFRKQLLMLNRYFEESCIVLTEGAGDYATRAWCVFELILSSRRKAILNYQDLEGQLKQAFELVGTFGETQVLNFNAKRKYGIRPGRNISPREFNRWAQSAMGLNRTYNQMEHDSRSKTLNWFQQHGLKATNGDDIEVIVGLLDNLL